MGNRSWLIFSARRSEPLAASIPKRLISRQESERILRANSPCGNSNFRLGHCSCINPFFTMVPSQFMLYWNSGPRCRYIPFHVQRIGQTYWKPSTCLPTGLNPFPSIDPAPETQSRFVREATEQPEIDDLERLPCLVLRFSDRLKNRLGLITGQSPPADLMMPNIPGVSESHFALTFDQQKELVVKDLDSSFGTRTIYDGEERQRGCGVISSARGPGLVKDKVHVLNSD